MSPPPDQPVATEGSDRSGSGVEARSENRDVNGDANAAAPRRNAWSRPSSGVSEGVSVMGDAVSWPALSESTKPVPRSSNDVSRPIRDGSASPTQRSASSQAPQGQPIATSHPKSVPSHSRQRSRNQNGVIGSSAGATSSGTGPSHAIINRHIAQAPPSFPGAQHQYIPPVLDASNTGTRPARGVGSYTGSDNYSNRNFSRRANYGPRPHGEGQYHSNHGGRWDQDHRDVVFIPPYMNPAIRFVTPPFATGAPSFFPPAPPPMPIFPQTGFDMSSFIYSPAMPAMAISPPPVPMPSPSNETPLATMIVNQIDYYFSDENLIKDPFLRSKMDDNGWVPITLIASFRQVERLTSDISLILESLALSDIVEVQGDKVRRRDVWSKWLLPSVPQFRTSSVAASLQEQLEDYDDSKNDNNTK